MMDFRYKNEKCPVCEKEFEENEDIVVCPVCGAPHHRECYKQNGECAYTDSHSEGFRWEPQSTEKPPVREKTQPKITVETNFGQSPFALFPKEVADGVTTEEAATFIQLNAFRYIDRFFHQKEGKNTWNWMAFLFAPYWFFARKLHKIGAIFLAVIIAVNVGFSFIPSVVKYSEEIYNIREEAMEEMTPEAYSETLKSVAEVSKNNPTAVALVTLQTVVIFALRIVSGMFANKWYYKLTVQSVRNVKKETDDESRRKLMLFKRGGMSAGAPVLAVMASSCVTMAISLLL